MVPNIFGTAGVARSFESVFFPAVTLFFFYFLELHALFLTTQRATNGFVNPMLCGVLENGH